MTALFFDKQDRLLLSMVNAVLHHKASSRSITTLFASHLHPRGIKEMADSREIRVAYAVIKLLDSLEVGKADDRIKALRALRDEVLYCVENQGFARNAARVLLEIMKHLIRVEDNPEEQLRLAHDFRQAMTGKPALVRKFLVRYHLMEMPEEWNQVSFDHHVHDANTKGRKSSTHLIMDAWIKGIRSLTVIYYNFITPLAAKELMEAARIMDVDVRIGIEIPATFRGKIVSFVWTPSGLDDVDEFLAFLNKDVVIDFFAQRKTITAYHQKKVVSMLHIFNRKCLDKIKQLYDLDVEPLEVTDLIIFVGDGQMSMLHLTEFIHASILPLMEKKVAELKARYAQARDEGSKEAIRDLVAKLNRLDPEEIFQVLLQEQVGSHISDEQIETAQSPDIINITPNELLESLHKLRAGNKITLGLSRLDALDTIELLYDGRGLITHLEVYNHKDFLKGRTPHYAEIIELQRAINGSSIIALKKHIQGLLAQLSGDSKESAARAMKFRDILFHLAEFQSFYHRRPLRIRIGSDSTGKSNTQHGMGFVVLPTVPRRVKATIFSEWTMIPIRMRVYLHKIYNREEEVGVITIGRRRLLKFLAMIGMGYRVRRQWEHQNTLDSHWHISNVVALGGRRERGNHFVLDEAKSQQRFRLSDLKYLNTGIQCCLKILTGFIPAFFTFYLTKDWWVLAYLGAPIWFAITGVRNILQAVMGGGGIRRAPLLHWMDYVSWRRVADSLLFTGFSVPLLDFVVKTVILNRMLGINVTTAPTTLYAAMALTNGVYLSSHNILRGLPREAIIGNFFRSILSIPLAIFFSDSVASIMNYAQVVDVPGELQKWAAIISKAASDTIAGIIEGTADRRKNIALRYRDYISKISQLFDSYDKIVLLYPDKDVLQMLDHPREFVRILKTEQTELLTTAAYDSLDLLYFWMYQPYARKVLRSILRSISPEERTIFVRFQSVLKAYKQISKLFIKGLIGGNFSRSLAFYLDRSSDYLHALQKLENERNVIKNGDGEKVNVQLDGQHHADHDIKPAIDADTPTKNHD